MIELLVVVSIIAILAGLLLPVLNRTTKKSQITQSQNNLRQIGSALMLYAGDNSGSFPTAGAVIPYGSIDAQTGLPGWQEQIDSYVQGDRKIFRSVRAEEINPASKLYSYFISSHAAGIDAQLNGGAFAPVQIARIQNPSRFLLAGEIASPNLFSETDADKDDYNTNNPAFHNKPTGHRALLLFADGHTESLLEFDPSTIAVQYDGPKPEHGPTYTGG